MKLSGGITVIERLEHYIAIQDIVEVQPAEDPFAAFQVDQSSDAESVEAAVNAIRQAWQLGTSTA